MKQTIRARLKGWWSAASEASTAVSILQYLGLWETVCAVALSLLNGWLAYMDSQSLWVVMTVFLFTASCLLWAINQIAIAKDRRFQSTPNYEVWDGFSDFNTWEAACLWDERPVTSGRLSENGLAIMRAIESAIDEGQIKGAPLNGSGNADRNTRVTRAQLMAFAGMRSEQPKFLYKDKR